MGWIIGRHCFYSRSGDFSSLLSLTHLISLVLTGYGILSKSNVKNGTFDDVWIICVSASLFIFSLLCTRKLPEPVGKPTLPTYILAPLISLSIATLIAQTYYHKALLGLTLHIISISFSLTGFPFSFIFVLVSIGISIGIVILMHINSSYSIKSLWIDVALLSWQAIGGLLMYKRFEILAMMIVDIKKQPLLSLENCKFVDALEGEVIKVLDRDDVIELFSKPIDSQRVIPQRLMSSNALLGSNTIRSSHTIRSLSSRVDSRLVETIITNRSYKIPDLLHTDFSAPNLQKSFNTVSYISEAAAPNLKDKYLDEFKSFEFNVSNPSRRRSLNKLPVRIKIIIGFFLYCFKQCYEMRDVLLRATWTNEDLLAPRNCLGLFSCGLFEDWYLEWMHQFNIKFYTDSVYISLLYCYYVTVSSAIAYIKHYSSLQSEITDTRRLIVIVRFIAQPAAMTIVLLPIIICKLRKSTMRSHFYYYWLSAFICVVQGLFSFFDMIWMLSWDYPDNKYYNCHCVEYLLMYTSVLLMARYPSYYTLFSLYILGFVSIHLVLHLDPRIRIITAESAPQIVTAIGSFFFYVRPVDISRRMLFCRYVLPYLLHIRTIHREKVEKLERLDEGIANG